MKFRKANHQLLLRGIFTFGIVTILVLPLSSMVLFKLIYGGLAVNLGAPTLELAGVFPEAPRPEFTLQSWFSHRFQEGANAWFNRYFGGRALFVRLGSQIYYSLIGTSYMNNQTILIGKQGQLYEAAYVYDYCKLTRPMAMEIADTRAREIAEVQNRLWERGIPFVLLISPSKASIYPEFIPDPFCNSSIYPGRDYETFIPLLDRYGISYVDGHAVTLEAKGRESSPLFCQGGTHWNYLGAYYTVDRLLREIETLTGQSSGKLSLQRVEIDHNPSGTDKDLAELLNLVFPVYDYPVPHPIITREASTSSLRKIIFVGGSFNWTILDILDSSKVFESMDAYYYYKLMIKSYPARTSRPIEISAINWDKDFLTAQAIILEVNEINFRSEYVSAFLSDLLQHLRLSQNHPQNLTLAPFRDGS